MSIPSGRISRRGEETRDQILKAARKLFAENGYHRTSVYDLFDRAGITKGAFFHHWKSKEELAITILDDLRNCFEREYFSLIERPGRSREKLDFMLRRLGDINHEEDWVYGRIFALWCTELDATEGAIGMAMAELRRRWTGLWQELIQRAQREGDLRTDISAENLSFVAIGAIFGVILMSAHKASPEFKRACETLRRTLLS